MVGVVFIKSVCVTGHRDIPDGQVEYVKQELRKEILLAVNEGYTHFLSGFAESADLYFAEIVAEIKKENPYITLEAVIPYRRRLNTNDSLFQRLIKQCDKLMVQCEEYKQSCFMDRNKYMVDNTDRVIAVYDGRYKGGTAATVRYARKMGRELHIITVK